jgi:hypothetical protein
MVEQGRALGGGGRECKEQRQENKQQRSSFHGQSMRHVSGEMQMP